MNGKRSQWNRREVLQTGLKGGTAAIAAAYGLRPDYASADAPLEFDGANFQLKAPEPNPKRGGVLRYGITSRPPHFDVHQSGTINSLGCQGCMFDNLIRRDPRDSGKTIIPDLAHSWEIAKDGKTYTFHLREGVTFHDGADFTSEDVKATYDRICKPPAGVSIPRSTLFTTVSEITAPDKKTVVFKLSRPRPVQEQAPRRERSLGDGEEPELLEQGPALSRRHRVLSRPAVLARARFGAAVQPRRLRTHRRSGDGAQGQG